MAKFKKTEKKLVKFLQTEVKKTGLENVILGLSGGLDSAVVAVLLKKAFNKNVKAIMMPSSSSSKESIKDAKALCKKFDIEYEIHPIGDIVDVYFNGKSPSKLRVGNFAARIRMATLYDISAKYQALVIGTSNKSELMLGYGTIFGDLACAINPIGDIYKSDIFKLAKHLKVNKSIIKKPPSADLWEGQKDEDELGFSYAKIDKVLKDFLEKSLNKEALAQKGYNKKLVDLIIKRYTQNSFKRALPTIAKIHKEKR